MLFQPVACVSWSLVDVRFCILHNRLYNRCCNRVVHWLLFTYYAYCVTICFVAFAKIEWFVSTMPRLSTDFYSIKVCIVELEFIYLQEMKTI